MAKTTLNMRSSHIWIRFFVLGLGLVGILWLMGYFGSGDFTRDPAVQSFMSPLPEHPRAAHVIIDRRTKLSPTPAKDR